MQKLPADLITIEGFINPNNSKEIHTQSLNLLLTDVQHNKIAMHQLVSLLGDHLTSLDELVRSRGTLLLSEMLTRLPSLPLDQTAAHFLTGFYCDRLQDYPCVGEVLKGVLALVRHHALSVDDPELVARTIFQEIQCQSLPQAQRKHVLDILNLLMKNYPKDMQNMRNDFIFGLIQTIDGEKDPRNLLVAFELFVNTIKTVPEFTRFTEELFEIVSCYFPITFKPRADDPDAITPEALSAALRACLCVTPSFAPFCFSFLLDKLASSMVATKLESLSAISQCCHFGSVVIAPYIQQLWAGLRNEILTSKEPAVVDQALATVSEIVRILSIDIIESDNKSPLEEFLQLLITDCTHQITGFSDSKLAILGCRILAVATTGSVRAAEVILRQCFPFALRQLEEGDLSSQQILLELMCSFIVSTQAAFRVHNILQPNNETLHPLVPYGSVLYERLSSALVGSDEAVKCSCLAGLAGLCEVAQEFPGLLSSNLLDSIMEHLTTALIGEASIKVCQTALESLAAISRVAPLLILSHTIPRLFARLNEHASGATTDAVVFSALAALSAHPGGALFNGIVPELLSTIKSSLATGRSVQFVTTALSCFASVILNIKSTSLMAQCSTEYLPQLTAILAEHAMATEVPLNNELLSCSMKIARLISQHTEERVQSKLIEDLTRVFLKGQTQEYPAFSRLPSLDPFASKSLPQLQLVSIYTTVVSQAKPSVTIAMDVLYTLMPVATNVMLPFTATSAIKCIASILNKSPNDAALIDVITITTKHFLQISLSAAEPIEKRGLAILSLAWILKGLVQRDHSEWHALSMQFVELLDTDVALQVATALENVLGDDEEALTKPSGALVRVLYKQRFFATVFPRLLHTFKERRNAESSSPSTPHALSFYLLAISNLLKHIPKSVLMNELQEILPILVQSLSSPNTALVQSTLDTLHMLLQYAPSSVGDYVSSFLPLLLNLSTSSSSAGVRRTSLQCIALCTTITFHKIFPHKPHVIEGLKKCLDDKIRFVRKEAVKTRNTWFVLASNSD